MTIPRDPANPSEKAAWQAWGTPPPETPLPVDRPVGQTESEVQYSAPGPVGENIVKHEEQAGDFENEETILAEADRIINGVRNGSYGNATPAFTQYARMWSVILGTEVTAKQVALCMAGLKICRETVKPQRDNRVDACGYLGLADQIETGIK